MSAALWFIFIRSIRQHYSLKSLHPQTTLWTQKQANEGELRAADLRLYLSYQHSQSPPCSSLQSHSPSVFSQCSPWAWLCWMTLNRPSAPHIFKAWYGQSTAWCPTDPAHLLVSVQGLPFAWNPPKAFLSFYPGTRSEFQIRIRIDI